MSLNHFGLPGDKTLFAQHTDFATQTFQCSFVYPYPSVSDLAGGNSDHGPRKTRTKTQTTPDSAFARETRNSDHGLSLGCFWVGVDEGAPCLGPYRPLPARPHESSERLSQQMGCTQKGSCNNMLLRRVLQMFCRRFLEGFLEGVVQWTL